MAGGMKHFTCHDLRRSASTVMRENGVKGDIVELMLNHRKTGLAAIYDQSDQKGPMREATDILGAAIARCIGDEPNQQGGDVIEFPSQAAG